jgi:hypothetical protein
LVIAQGAFDSKKRRMEEVKDRFGESVSNQTVVDAVQRIMSPSTVVN